MGEGSNGGKKAEETMEEDFERNKWNKWGNGPFGGEMRGHRHH